MESKKCTKCGITKQLGQFRKRGESLHTSACCECERKRSREFASAVRGTPYGKFKLHAQNAERRGIAFLLTYEQWKSVWDESGHWDQRGRGADKYCMCRFGDTGAYEIGNVFIDLGKTNVRNGNLGRVISEEIRKKISLAHSGKPHPWSAGDKNPMHRPEAKAKIKEATGGTKHYRSKGGVSTPIGFFESTLEAARALGIPAPTVQWRCRNNKLGFSYGNNIAFA